MVWNERQVSEIIAAQQQLRREGKRDIRTEIAAFMPIVTIIVALGLILMWLN